MELSYSTIALLFPAIPLMFLVYSNTSMGLGGRLREIFERLSGDEVSEEERKRAHDEASYLSKRLVLLRLAQMLCGLTFLFNITTLFSIYASAQVLAQALFACAVIVLMLSVIAYLVEISISVRAVRIVWKKLQ
jgi:hypothetical protein